MSFGHKRLHVYQAALEYVAWVYANVERFTGPNRHARDQLLRASQSIALNIAEGNGKFRQPDRRRFFAIARASALECAAIQDVLCIGGALSETESTDAEQILVRIVSMLTKMARPDDLVREESSNYYAHTESDITEDHD